MSKDTGGPAFPEAGLDPWNKAVETNTGMTLRDYFAAQAMQAILGKLESICPQDCIAVAEDAYFIAGKMLEARK